MVTEELQNEFERFWDTNQDRPLRGRDKIVASVCPQVLRLKQSRMRSDHLNIIVVAT